MAKGKKDRRRFTLSAGSISGTPVRNLEGEDLGKIEELMIDLSTGRVAYAVLSFGGLLGIGDKLFAMPWSALSVDQESHEILLDVPKEQLENAPGFDKHDWPDFSDLEFETSVHEYYDVTPYWS